MNHYLFSKACELIEESGSNYQNLITPFFSEKQNGVVIPVAGIVIPLQDAARERVNWDEALAIVTNTGDEGKALRLPTISEWMAICLNLDLVNSLLKEHGGEPFKLDAYWAQKKNTTCMGFIASPEGGTVYIHFERFNYTWVRGVMDFQP